MVKKSSKYWPFTQALNYNLPNNDTQPFDCNLVHLHVQLHKCVTINCPEDEYKNAQGIPFRTTQENSLKIFFLISEFLETIKNCYKRSESFKSCCIVLPDAVITHMTSIGSSRQKGQGTHRNRLTKNSQIIAHE